MGIPRSYLPSLNDLDGKGIAAAEAVTKALQVILVQPVVFEHHSIQGRNTEKPSGLILLYGRQNGIGLGHGHEDRCVAEIQTDRNKESKGHDMKEGVDRNIGILSFLNVTGHHLFHNIPDIRGHPEVISRHPLGKARRSAGIEDVSQDPSWGQPGYLTSLGGVSTGF